jgi:hypothetical protein
MTVKRTLGIAAGALAAAALVSWTFLARHRRLRRGSTAAAASGTRPAPSAWGGAAVFR